MRGKALKAADSVKKLEGGTQRLTKALGKATREANKTGDSLERAGKGGGKFAGALGKIKTSLVGLVGPAATAGLGTLVSGMRDLAQDSEAAAGAMERLETSRRQFLQISKTPRQFAKFTAKSAEVALAAGITDRDVAQRFAFQAVSADAADKAAQIARAATGLGIDPGTILDAIVTTRAAFGKEENRR